MRLVAAGAPFVLFAIRERLRVRLLHGLDRVKGEAMLRGAEPFLDDFRVAAREVEEQQNRQATPPPYA